MLSANDLNQIKSVVTDIVLDSESRIRKDMANMKLELQKYTEEASDSIINTLEIMFPEKSPHLKSRSKYIS